MKRPTACSDDLAAIEARATRVVAVGIALALLCVRSTFASDDHHFALDDPRARWPGYQIIMWQPQSADQYRALKALGVTAGSVPATRDDNSAKPVDEKRIESLKEAGLRWYIENIATDFYAPYHKWSPDHPVNWRFLDAQKAYRENPLDRAAFVREPSLSDPAWIEKIRKRLTRIVAGQTGEQPLYYSLGDETGVGDLAAYWDFDFSPASLAAMRDWLKTEYGMLDALNQQWGTQFESWTDVVPMTTAEAMRRTDGNYSAWADFKAWMDIAYARALQAGTDAVHAANPVAFAGIEGGQIPGWGGYDYARLAKTVDVMEIYDNGANVEIARSFNPSLILLTTSFEGGLKETHRIWRELLQGSRGLILWDEDHGFVQDDGHPGPRGRDAGSTFRDIEKTVAPLLAESSRHYDPIAILYSQASFRTHWMLDWKDKGDAWSRRSAEDEYQDTPFRSAMTGYLDAAEHLGYQPRFISPEQVENGVLSKDGYRMLILPHAIALSAAEAKAIRQFAAKGGLVVADEEPGLFDQHSRKLTKPLLSDLFMNSLTLPPSPRWGEGVVFVAPDALRSALKRADIEPEFPVSLPSGVSPADIRTYVFKETGKTILALHRDLPRDPSSANKESIILTLPRAASVYDVRKRKELGRLETLTLDLDAYEPTILTIGGPPD